MILWQLQVVLGAGRLVTGRDPAIHPISLFQDLPSFGHLLGRKYIGDGQ
jgi:hypothetical protein